MKNKNYLLWSIVILAIAVLLCHHGFAASTVLIQDDFEGDLSAWQVSAPAPNRAIIHNLSFSDGFENGLAGWTLNGSPTTVSSPVYEGSASLCLDYQGTYTAAVHSIPTATNLRARVYFYDNGDQTLGTIFQLSGTGTFDCGWGPIKVNTGLAVKTDVSASYYVFRANCPNITGVSGMFPAEEIKPDGSTALIKRTNGWHLFEIIVTPTGTYARIDDRVISRSNPLQTDANEVAFASTWGLTGQAYYDGLSIQAGYQSGKSLFIDYIDPNGPSEKAVILNRSFTPSTNLLARTYFFDTMDSSLGSIFELTSDSATRQTALGVVTDVSPTNYVIRIDSRVQTYDTGIKRSAGWHVFEIVVTDRGTYAKIDNHLISQSNPNQLSADTVWYVSTWGASAGLLGQALYDNLTIVTADNADWRDQLFTPLEVHFNQYSSLVPPGGVTIFSPIYPTLGSNLHSNDLRSLKASALTWYLYGQKTGNTTAKSLAKRVFLEGWANAPWKRGQDVNDWARGACMRVVAHAAHALWNELDQTTRDDINQVIRNQINTYLNRMPESGYEGDTKAEENAWHAAFLAAVANLFPSASYEWVEPKARCFAYHSITTSSDPPYCGIKTQTVYDDFRLENHGQLNPAYSCGTLQLLAEGALAYRIAGRPIPSEFTHNVQPLFNKYMTYVDPNTYHFVNAPPDWHGAHNSAFISPTVFCFMDLLGIPTGVSWQDFASKRSIFYNGISSCWLTKDPPFIRIQQWNQWDKTEDSYKFFLDSVDSGEFGAMATYFLRPSAPTNVSSSQTICKGNIVPLSATPGAGGTTVRWYIGGCGTTLVGTGTSITVSPTATTTYYARSFSDISSLESETCVPVTITVNIPPSITANPASQTKCTGGSVTFTVGAGGTTPLNYQWRKGASNISGATTTTYTISSVSTGNVGSYNCVVTNTCGSATSTTATLTVNTAPTVTAHPTSQTVCWPNSATFSVVATGTPTPTYQWRKDGSNIPGATATTYTATNAGSYSCVVSNSCGAVTSASAQLTIIACGTRLVLAKQLLAPSIHLIPTNLVTIAGRVTSSTPVKVNDGSGEITVTGVAATPGQFMIVTGNWNGSVLSAILVPVIYQ